MDEMTRQLIIEIRYRVRETAAMREVSREAKAASKAVREAKAAARVEERRQKRAAAEAARDAKRVAAERKTALRSLGGQIDGVANSILGMAKLGAGIGLAAGAGLGWQFLQAAKGAEDARLGITTLVQSADSMVNGPFKGVNDAFAFSADLIAQMRQEAISTPATFDDIKRSFRDVAVSARSVGAEYSDIIKLSGNMSTLGKVLGFEEGVVSRDVQQLLRGEIGDINTPQLRAIRKQSQELYKAGKAAEQLKLIMGSMKLPPELRAMFENSFEGRFSTLQDEWAMFAQEAGKPILDYLSEEMRQILDYISKNREAVKGWAKEIGEGVVSAVKDIKAALVWMWEHRDEIIEWAKMLVGGALLVKALGIVGDIVSGFKGLYAVFTYLQAHPLVAALTGIVAGLAIFGAVAGEATYSGAQKDADKKELAGQTAANKMLRATNKEFDSMRDWMANPKTILGLNSGDAAQNAQLQSYLRRADEIKTAAGNLYGLNDTTATIGMAINASKAQDELLQTLRRANDPMQVGLAEDKDLINAYLDAQRESIVGSLPYNMKDGTSRKDGRVTPVNNVDARGSRITINQRVETDNPAALARVSLLAGFQGVVSKVIRPNSRPGSVRLGNGDRG